MREYRVASFYKIITIARQIEKHHKILWKNKAPFRVPVFIWLLNKEANLTWDKLQKRVWQGPAVCTPCNKSKENNNYFFLMWFHNITSRIVCPHKEKRLQGIEPIRKIDDFWRMRKRGGLPEQEN